MKNLFRICTGLVLSTLIFSSCKHSDNSIYYYSKDRDVIAPEIKISVPLANDLYHLTYDVHVVGTVKDMETTTTSGSLLSLNMVVNQIDPANGDKVLKVLMNKNPNVDGKDGYTMNEKFVVNYSSSTVYCRLKVLAYDQTGRFDVDSVDFSIVP